MVLPCLVLGYAMLRPGPRRCAVLTSRIVRLYVVLRYGMVLQDRGDAWYGPGVWCYQVSAMHGVSLQRIGVMTSCPVP
eukprot:3649475-Rhodomonas_salina.3